MGGHHASKNKPREDLTDDQLIELCVIAVRQHRDDCRLWKSLRVGLVNHLGHEICQDLEIWVAHFYGHKRQVPTDTDVEAWVHTLIQKRRAAVV
mmetsp:Transcript_40247/g.95381  ORF Transcript_40247/g.95381 Transcript_40247/m.95381 type:complete len:94 (+) Transcript_40247:123-404(+)